MEGARGSTIIPLLLPASSYFSRTVFATVTAAVIPVLTDSSDTNVYSLSKLMESQGLEQGTQRSSKLTIYLKSLGQTWLVPSYGDKEGAAWHVPPPMETQLPGTSHYNS